MTNIVDGSLLDSIELQARSERWVIALSLDPICTFVSGHKETAVEALLEAFQLCTTIYSSPQRNVQYHSTLRQSSNFGALAQICSRPVAHQ